METSEISKLLVGRNQGHPFVHLQEAIPYEEFHTNPFLMLATTPTGGHLGWLPLGKAKVQGGLKCAERLSVWGTRLCL